MTESKSLLGKFTYYKRFIEGLSEITRPIVQAYMDPEKSGHKRVKVTKKVREAVELLKNKITSAPILAHPDWTSQEPFRAKADFSWKALEAKITQLQKDSEGILQEGDSLRLEEIHGDQKQISKQQGRTSRIHLGMLEASFLAIPKKIHICDGPHSAKSDQDDGISPFAVSPLAGDSSKLQLHGRIQKSSAAY